MVFLCRIHEIVKIRWTRECAFRDHDGLAFRKAAKQVVLGCGDSLKIPPLKSGNAFRGGYAHIAGRQEYLAVANSVGAFRLVERMKHNGAVHAASEPINHAGSDKCNWNNEASNKFQPGRWRHPIAARIKAAVGKDEWSCDDEQYR